MRIDLEQIRESSRATLGEFLGMEITEVSEGFVKIVMPVTQNHKQPMGLLHGGASVALAETAASIGGWIVAAKDGKAVVGQEINANHLKAVRDGNITATAQIIHAGKRSQVWEVKIHNDQGDLICISRCTLAVI